MRKSPKLEAARAEMKRLWLALCEHDGVAPSALFISFSNSNPFFDDYNKAMGAYQRLRKAQQKRAARRDAIASLGMKEVRGALGGRYIE